MADTRVLSNKHRNIYVAPVAATPFTQSPFTGQLAVADFADFLDISSVIKWDGTDFGIQESDTIDDRVLTDDASAQSRGFSQFGGSINLLYPSDYTDTTDIAQQAFELFRTPRTQFYVIERVVVGASVAEAAGQTFTVTKVISDGFSPDTEGDDSYAYTVNLVPQGDVYISDVIATGLTIVESGHDTTLAVGAATWGKALLGTTNVTVLATYSSSAPAVATVTNNGIIVGVSAGTATITVAYRDGTADTILITVA